MPTKSYDTYFFSQFKKNDRFVYTVMIKFKNIYFICLIINGQSYLIPITGGGDRYSMRLVRMYES